MYRLINRIGGLVVGIACVLFGVIGWLWHYCEHIPMLIICGLLFMVYALFVKTDLVRFIWSAFSILFMIGMIIFNNVYLAENIHTWVFFTFCIAFIIYFIVDAIIQWPKGKGKGETEEQAAPAATAVEPIEEGEPYYLIRTADSGKVVFYLKDAKSATLATSGEFDSADAAKESIAETRKLAYTADVDDMTNADDARKTGARYEMYNYAGKIMRSRLVNEENVTLVILPDADNKGDALKAISNMVSDSQTEKVVDRTGDKPVTAPDAALFRTEEAEEETRSVINAARAAVATHISTEKLEEAPEGEGTEVVGIAFPERPKVYFFKPEADGVTYQVGDVVLVPTLSIDRVVGVAVPNIRLTDDKLVLPLKSILQVVSRA